MNEAEQRKAFEAFFIASGLAYEWGGTVWFHDASHANDLWRGWQAAASIHAEKVEQLRAALQGLLPVTFTGNPSRADEVAHWEREKELGNGNAAAVLAAYAAIAKATGEQS